MTAFQLKENLIISTAKDDAKELRKKEFTVAKEENTSETAENILFLSDEGYFDIW